MRIALRLTTLVTVVLAQTPPRPGTIAGHVVDFTTGRPVAGTTVRLDPERQADRRLASALTRTSDSKGVFVFDDVVPGDYGVMAENDTGLGRYGATVPNSDGRRLHVSAGAHVDDITIPIWVLATIEGRVTDERGAALGGVFVQLGSPESVGSMWTKTGPDGHYRARHIRPGEYIAAVDNWLFNLPLEPDPPAPSRSGAPPPFRVDSDRRTLMITNLPFPANDETGRRLFVTSVYSRRRDGRAESIHVTGSEVHRRIDIIVRTSAGVRVAGTLTTPSGPVKGGAVNLHRVDLPEYPDTAGISTNARPDGTFAFVAVPPGRYQLTAFKIVPPLTMARLDRAGIPVMGMDDNFTSDTDDFFLQQSLDVGSTEMSNLALSMQRGTTVSGKLTVDDHVPVASTGCVYLVSLVKRLQWGDSRVGCAGPDGAFSLRARPGAYVITAGPLSKDWAYDGASIRGQHITDGPISVGSEPIGDVHVRLTSRRRGIEGTVVTADGRVPDGAAVIVFPQDRTQWPNRPGLGGGQIYPDRYMRMSTTDGRFEFLRLLPGEYFVAAVADDGLLGRPITPATTLSRLVRIATRVTVQESGLSNVRLRLR